MATVKDYRVFGAGASNALEVTRVFYDSAAGDALGTGAQTMLTAQNKLIVVQALVNVLTAVTSSGSGTVIVGTTGDTDAIMDVTQGAVANLVAGYVQGGKSLPAAVAAGQSIIMTVGTTALLAGKFEVFVWTIRAN